MRKLVGCLVILIAAPCARPIDLDSLLLKSAGSAGALETINRLKTIASSGTVVLNGQAGTFTHYVAVPDRYYLNVSFEGFSLVQAFDGAVAWQQDMNGGVSRVEGYARRELLKNLYFESFLYLKSSGEERAYLGTRDLDGTLYHLVAFFPYDDDTVYCFFNVETARRELLVTSLDQVTLVSYLGDYRPVSELPFPFYQYGSAEEIAYETEFTVDTVVLNGTVPDSIFAMPVIAASDYHFPDHTQAVVIPFSYAAGHIRVPIVISGRKKSWAILDSGASANILHTAAVSELDLPAVGRLPVMGVAGYEEVDLVRTDSLQVGELTLYRQVAGAMDLSDVSSHFGFDSSFGGMLGHDFLSRFPMLVRFSDSSLVVFNPESFEPPPGGTAVDFFLTMLIPTVEAEINGIGGRFIVDLGNAYSVVLHHHFVRENDLANRLTDVAVNRLGFGGVGGTIGGRSATAATFTVGGVSVESLQVFMPDSGSGIAGSEALAGNIGSLFLQNYDVLFDYRNSRIIFYEAGSVESD
ncbi:MAG: clan AA aspartic protease [Candidatus Zixiibacteriota bacterium]|nr:MAG: clan AA aspartic protease [candidate division Zixibacteria bacterium]